MFFDNLELLVPDYKIPQALIVPHGNFTIRATLEDIAREASKYVGVVLLSSDPELSRAFVEDCPFPEHISIVAAPFDTPWIRDRSPIAVGNGSGYDWICPKAHMVERELDSNLFSSIINNTTKDMDLVLPQGNLVGGPYGLAISTDRILSDNTFETPTDLIPFKEQLGIQDWLLIRPHSSDTVAHTDCYVRFVRSDTVVLANAPQNDLLTETMEILEDEILNLFPWMKTVTLPITMRDGMLESPLNWIQIGNILLVPLFPKTTPSTCMQIRVALEELSFQVVFIPSPTTQYGGALHCLTGSVFF